MKPFSSLALCSALVISLLSLAGIAEEPLRWKLEKGQRFQLQTQQQTESQVSYATKKLPSSVNLLLHVSWEVQEAAAEKFVVAQTIDSVRIEMKGQGDNATVYDSRERKAVVGAAKDLAAAVAPLLGAKFTFTMTPLGEVAAADQVSVEGGAGIPGLNQESINQLLKQSLLPLPKSFEGSTPAWTDERQATAALGVVKQKRTFTLAGMEDRAGQPAAKITVTGELELTPVADRKGSPKLKDQSFSGTIWFSREAGRLLTSETKQRLVTESAYRDSTINVDLTTTITSTLTPRE
ncbi:hypothetical protein ETAA8_55510 [Anatilimnocola aggregata]|uniref:Uncharacterized protein n=1 Tax=Anatilimnocola aggregata TaxID=2528021 RepID=A0A517YJK7_9BACT|nr:hypothetical protein [Anatilimnocola aggregata]QDU30411.1 hypothetical protein ETAA8_55510 [Anatilimnocola aggregata]